MGDTDIFHLGAHLLYQCVVELGPSTSDVWIVCSCARARGLSTFTTIHGGTLCMIGVECSRS